jgi:hypothetical protein
MKKMEKVNDDLFQNLTEEEAQLVAGGADATADATWSEANGWDAKADITFKLF